MPATDKTSRYFSFFNAGRINIASTFWQSSMYSSLNTESNLSTKLMIPLDVIREHSLKFIEHNKGADETIEFSPSSDRRYAPFRDNVVNDGKLFGDRAKIASIT